MISHDELVVALQQHLPDTDAETVEAIAIRLHEALSTRATSAADTTIERNDMAEALRELARQQAPVETANAQISFGESSQTGDVTFRDVAGRDITHIHIELKTPAQNPPPPDEPAVRRSLAERWKAFLKLPPVALLAILGGLIIAVTTITANITGTLADWRDIQPTTPTVALDSTTSVAAPLPTPEPTLEPTTAPTLEPTLEPTTAPTLEPTTATLTANVTCPRAERVRPTDCALISPYAWPEADNPDDVPAIVSAWTFRTGQSDDNGNFFLAELRYDLPKPGTYAGIAFTFQRDWEDLSYFEAIQVRVGFAGELDRCRLYLKTATTNRPELDKGNNPPPDGDIPMGRDLAFKEGIVADPPGPIRTITIPLRTIFPNTPLDRIKEIGFIAGVYDSRPTSGLCRVYDVVLLKTMP